MRLCFEATGKVSYARIRTATPKLGDARAVLTSFKKRMDYQSETILFFSEYRPKCCATLSNGRTVAQYTVRHPKGYVEGGGGSKRAREASEVFPNEDETGKPSLSKDGVLQSFSCMRCLRSPQFIEWPKILTFT